MKMIKVKFQNLDDFPGWSNAPDFIEREVLSRRSKYVADVGGGANPMLKNRFIESNGIHYSVLDISIEELDKAPTAFNKILVDVTGSSDVFTKAVNEQQFDLIFSHMFLEHVSDPIQVHKNLWHALKPGGVAIHFFPTPYNLPLAINRYLPDRITNRLIQIVQPSRRLKGNQGKFPTYYRMCWFPTEKAYRAFEQLGYQVMIYNGYIGNSYVRAIPILSSMERVLRKYMVALNAPLISAVLLILKRPEES